MLWVLCMIDHLSEDSDRLPLPKASWCSTLTESMQLGYIVYLLQVKRCKVSPYNTL
jgi:hypothetical protein